METLDTDILQSLQTATGQAVNASSLPSLPIKFLGRTWDIPNNQKYLEIVWLPNNRSNDFWGNEKIYRGSMRLILHWPNNDQGSYEPLSLLEELGSYFAKDKLLQNGVNSIQIYENSDISSPIEAGTESLYVVTVRYQCFASG